MKLFYKIKLLVPLLLIILALLSTGLCTSPKLIDNGYENIIVQIDENVPEHECASIFRGIKDIFLRASPILYSATSYIAYFRSVTVVVPESWSDNDCPYPIDSYPPPNDEPAIVVGDPHPVFQKMPWTLQEKGCGAPGKRIFMTPEFLRNPNTSAFGDPGRLLVHEWAKFRWGVFEEYGHVGDPVYPSFRQTDTQSFTPNGCSDVPVEGSPSSCDPAKEHCAFVPSLNQNDAVKSSLMYLHYLPRVTRFCDSRTHDQFAHTKHNFLCGRRSVWEVMRSHPDFQDSMIGEEGRDVTPTFRFVRPTARRYVILIEDTTIMNIQKRWDFLRKAIRKLLVYDFPPGAKVGVVLFNEAPNVRLPLTSIPLTLAQRQGIATRSMPRNPSQNRPSHKCVVCGIEKAIQILRDDTGSSAGNVIFLISSSTPIAAGQDEFSAVEEIVKSAGVKVVPIMYPVTNRNPQRLPGVEQLAEITGTRSFAVLDEGIGSDSKVSMMVSLMNALYSALRIFLPSPRHLPIMVHQQEFPGRISSTSEGSFDIDSSLGGKVTFWLTYYDLGHVGNTITLFDPTGAFLDSGSTQEEDNDVNAIIVTIRNATLGTWTYRVDNRADSHQSLFIQVMSTPSDQGLHSLPLTHSSNDLSTHLDAATYGSYYPTEAVALEGWTSSDKWIVNASDHDTPFTIYAQLWSGKHPVIGAKVEAVLQRMGLNETGNPFAPLSFTMFDNGNGDADLTKYDGIYSRHIPILGEAPARYSISLVASDGGGEAAIVAPSYQDPVDWKRHSHRYSSRKKRALPYGLSQPTCCGSVIQHTRTMKAERLSRSVSLGLLDVVGQRNPGGFDPPPSRVGDLRVNINPATLHATFTWTAPGGQRDHGRASRYEVVYSADEVAASRGDGELIEGWPLPMIFGEDSRYTIEWTRHDSLYFVSMRAVSRSGHAGPWSNIAAVFVPPPATTTEINTKGSTFSRNSGGSIGKLSPPSKGRGFLTQRDILAIVGAACGLLLIILIFAVYYMVVGTRRRDSKDKIVKDMESNGVAGGLSDKADDETDSISKQTPEAISGSEHSSGVVPRPLSPVQSWTASHLLAEHERRYSVDPTLGEAQDMGFSFQQHQFYYHTPNGHYIEDTIPIDSGSVVSTHHSDSLYKLDTSTAESLHVPIPHMGVNPSSWECPPVKRPKVPPPTLPKPSFGPSEPCPSEIAVLERRKRNVTQV